MPQLCQTMLPALKVAKRNPQTIILLLLPETLGIMNSAALCDLKNANASFYLRICSTYVHFV